MLYLDRKRFADFVGSRGLFLQIGLARIYDERCSTGNPRWFLGAAAEFGGPFEVMLGVQRTVDHPREFGALKTAVSEGRRVAELATGNRGGVFILDPDAGDALLRDALGPLVVGPLLGGRYDRVF